MTQKRLSNKPFTLSVNETYNYTIVTGSYPQSFIYALNSTHQRNQGHRSGVYEREVSCSRKPGKARYGGTRDHPPLFFSLVLVGGISGYQATYSNTLTHFLELI
jgi:hypothetical protein